MRGVRGEDVAQDGPGIVARRRGDRDGALAAEFRLVNGNVRRREATRVRDGRKANRPLFEKEAAAFDSHRAVGIGPEAGRDSHAGERTEVRPGLPEEKDGNVGAPHIEEFSDAEIAKLERERPLEGHSELFKPGALPCPIGRMDHDSFLGFAFGRSLQSEGSWRTRLNSALEGLHRAQVDRELQHQRALRRVRRFTP